MRKKNKIVFFALLIGSFFMMTVLTVAQSDYKITQDFKQQIDAFAKAIDAAKTKQELDDVEKRIGMFKNKQTKNKELLDNTLYPDNFTTSFEKLSAKIVENRSNLEQVTELETEVTNLQEEVSTLSSELQKTKALVERLRNENTKLFKELADLKAGADPNASAKMNSLVLKLKENIKKRDELIIELVENLFQKHSEGKESLNDAEKQTLNIKLQDANLLDNIKYLVSDNIRFLESTVLEPESISQLKKEQADFDKRWEMLRPRIAEIYADTQSKLDELGQVDALLYKWESLVNNRIWHAINQLFLKYELKLEPFVSGSEFYNSVQNFIEAEINNLYEKSSEEQQKTYSLFTDSVWNKDLGIIWMPIIREDSLLTQTQVDNIESKFGEWKSKMGEESPALLFIIIALFIIIIVVIIIAVMRKKKANKGLDDIIKSSEGNKDLFKE